MSYYRDVYLRSEDWKNLRLAKIAHKGSKCSLCWSVQTSPDVHHVNYRNLHDVGLKDLRVLCRTCHDKVHELLAKYPGMKRLEQRKQWKIIRSHLASDKESVLSGIVRKGDTSDRKERRRKANFETAKKVLVQMGIVHRRKMQWSEQLHQKRVAFTFRIPLIFIQEYVNAVGIDPRVHASPHRLIEF
jgi:hypothetical protein